MRIEKKLFPGVFLGKLLGDKIQPPRMTGGEKNHSNRTGGKHRTFNSWESNNRSIRAFNSTMIIIKTTKLKGREDRGKGKRSGNMLIVSFLIQQRFIS